MAKKTTGRAKTWRVAATLAINGKIIPFPSVADARARLATEIRNAKLRKHYIASTDADHVDVFQRVNDSDPIVTFAVRIIVR